MEGEGNMKGIGGRGGRREVRGGGRREELRSEKGVGVGRRGELGEGRREIRGLG